MEEETERTVINVAKIKRMMKAVTLLLPMAMKAV
jgi:hypothetical protein